MSTDAEMRVFDGYSCEVFLTWEPALHLPLAKAAQDQQRPIVSLRPDVSAIDTNVVLVFARRGKEDSRQNADALLQRGPVQFKSIDFRGQFNPQHVTARRPADARARRKIPGDGLPHAFQLTR